MIAAENQSVLSAFMIVILTRRIALLSTRPKGVVSDGAQMVLFRNLCIEFDERNAVLVFIVSVVLCVETLTRPCSDSVGMIFPIPASLCVHARFCCSTCGVFVGHWG